MYTLISISKFDDFMFAGKQLLYTPQIYRCNMLKSVTWEMDIIFLLLLSGIDVVTFVKGHAWPIIANCYCLHSQSLKHVLCSELDVADMTDFLIEEDVITLAEEDRISNLPKGKQVSELLSILKWRPWHFPTFCKALSEFALRDDLVCLIRSEIWLFQTVLPYEHHKAIQRNWGTLINEMYTRKLIDWFYSKNIITIIMKERIERESTDKLKNKKLLRIILQRGPNVFHPFCQALEGSDTPWLAEKLRNSSELLKNATLDIIWNRIKIYVKCYQYHISIPCMFVLLNMIPFIFHAIVSRYKNGQPKMT